jgi:peptidoglycan/LPS O-acetylase OafA/YrhL
LLLAGFTILWVLHVFDWLAPAEFSQCFPYRCFPHLIMLSVYFAAGSLCFLYREEIRFTRGLVVAALVVVLASPALGCIPLIAPGAVTYVFLWLACKLPISRFDARGDFSYGLYIYAFPVQQVLALLGVQAGGFGLFAIWSVMLAAILAVLSYRFVEAPCLRLKGLRLPFALDRFSEHADCLARRLKRAG